MQASKQLDVMFTRLAKGAADLDVHNAVYCDELDAALKRVERIGVSLRKPDGKIFRDTDGVMLAEVTVVPGQVQPGKSSRVHLVLRPNPKQKAHWNNEAERLRVWIDPPEGWQTSDRLLSATPLPDAVSEEVRTLSFEIVAPANAAGVVRLPLYILFHICDDVGGQCRLLRRDVVVDLPIQRRKP